jgi:hypothetical protein
MSFAQRREMRRKNDREKRVEQRQTEATAKAEAKLNPPPPALPYDARKQLRKAEDTGRAQAKEIAAAEAKANAPIKNPFRQRQQEIKLFRGPAEQRKWDQYGKLADAWDVQNANEIAAAERQAAIDDDPQVRTAREYSAALLKTAPPEFQAAVAECVGAAEAGDAKLAWQKISVVEAEIFRHQDKVAADKRANLAVTNSDFNQSAEAAEFARIAAEHSAMLAAEFSPPEPEADLS